MCQWEGEVDSGATAGRRGGRTRELTVHSTGQRSSPPVNHAPKYQGQTHYILIWTSATYERSTLGLCSLGPVWWRPRRWWGYEVESRSARSPHTTTDPPSRHVQEDVRHQPRDLRLKDRHRASLTLLSSLVPSDLLVRVRYENPLPPPPFPPKLVDIPTSLSRYGKPSYVTQLIRETPYPMMVDAECGMPLDLLTYRGLWDGRGTAGQSAINLSSSPIRPMSDGESCLPPRNQHSQPCYLSRAVSVCRGAGQAAGWAHRALGGSSPRSRPPFLELTKPSSPHRLCLLILQRSTRPDHYPHSILKTRTCSRTRILLHRTRIWPRPTR